VAITACTLSCSILPKLVRLLPETPQPNIKLTS
jgi:hypothetical protein